MTFFYTNAFQSRDKIHFIGYSNGKRFEQTEDYKPYIFLHDKNGTYKTIQGRPVSKHLFESIRDAYNYIHSNEAVENFRFYGMTSFLYPCINDMFPGKIEYDLKAIKVNFLDIEVDGRNGFPRPETALDEVSAITLVRGDRIITLGIKYYKPSNKNVRYILCEDETDLLEKFLKVWNSEVWTCDIVSGWYIDGFDIPYLINRINRILGDGAANKLSPWGIIKEREIVRGKTTSSSKDIATRTDTVYDIAGITQLDYLQLYKKFTFTNHESYRLDNIAQVELNEKKLDYSNFKNLSDFYDKDPERYYDYNIHDAVLVQKLENKLGFINQVISFAYIAKVNYIDAFTTTRPWDVLIHNRLLAEKIVVPQPRQQQMRELVGAFVEEVQVGMHTNLFSFDFTGLYPRLICQHNISPETFLTNAQEDLGRLIDKIDVYLEARNFGNITSFLKEKDVTITANSCLFKRAEKGFIPKIIDEMIDMRTATQKEMRELEKLNDPKNKDQIVQLHNLQHAIKIFNNSLYGALGNQYFRWFDLNLAEAVTTTGQLYIKWVFVHVNEYLNRLLKTDNKNYIVAGDTDSMYVSIDELIKKCKPAFPVDFIDSVCQKKIEPLIKEKIDILANLLNSCGTKLAMKREIIADKGIWRAKKMYILNVLDKEGTRYEKPKLIFKGIEVVRSSIPMYVKNFLKESLRMIMQDTEENLQKYVAAFKKDFFTKSIIDIGKVSSVNGMDEYGDPVTVFKLGTPFHTKGALFYNKYITDNDLTRDHKLIKNQDKIRYTYLTTPNILHTGAFAIPDEGDIPKDLEEILTEYIDRHTQWEKTFYHPLESITSLIKWSPEKRARLSFV